MMFYYIILTKSSLQNTPFLLRKYTISNEIKYHFKCSYPISYLLINRNYLKFYISRTHIIWYLISFLIRCTSISYDLFIIVSKLKDHYKSTPFLLRKQRISNEIKYHFKWGDHISFVQINHHFFKFKTRPHFTWFLIPFLIRYNSISNDVVL